MNPFYKRVDLLITALLLLAGIGVLLWMNRDTGQVGLQAEIIKDSQVYKLVPLDQDTEFQIDGVTFEVTAGKIRFKSADCPDKLCVQSGFISKPNTLAVCLPNRLMVRVLSDAQAEYDAMAS